MKNNLGLTTLDAYAKRISTKQVNMLYENRMHKKYKKMVFEGSNNIFEDNFAVYVTIDAANGKPAELIKNVKTECNSVDLNYRQTETGIYFYTEMPDVYDCMKSALDKLGITYSDVTNI